MASKKKNNQKEQELFDMNKYGQYFVPDEVIRFLFNVTKPTPNEKILFIGFYEPTLQKIIGENFIGKVISSEAIPNEIADLMFDVILCAPFFGKIHTETNEPNEEMWLKWCISHLNPKGRTSFILPIGLLSNFSQEPIRHFLIDESNIQSVIEMSAGWAQGTSIQASILVAKSKKDTNKIVRFFRFSEPIISWAFLEKEIVDNNPSIPANVAGKVFSVESSKLDSKRLDAKYYDPIYDVTAPSSDYQAVTLSDIVEIRSGERFADIDYHNQGIPFVQVRNISPDGNLELKEVKYVKPEIAVNSRSFCQANDILITIAGTIGKVTRIRDNINVCIDTSLRKLKILDTNRILPAYLELYLRSDTAQRQMEKSFSGSVIRVLSTPNLEQLIIYIPSVEKQLESVKLFKKLLNHKEQALLSVFPDIEAMNSISLPPITTNSPSPETDDSKLKPESEKIEDIIKKEYPFPIARPFSAYEASNGDISSSRVKKLIALSESIVYYLYGILLADYTQRFKSTIPELSESIKPSIENYSIDRRIKFINQLIKIAKNNSDVTLFIPELLDAEIWICQEIHNQVRNKFSHTDPTDAWCKKALDDFHPKLMKLLNSLQSLRNYRLAQIRNLTIRDKRYQHSVASMTSDNSLFQTQVEDLDSALLADTNHVILIDQDYNILDLHPFYIFHAWESTGLQNHLCYLKQIIGEGSKQKMRLESIEGSGEIDIDLDTSLAKFLVRL